MTHYSVSNPTARKRHRCGTCYRPIEPGEEYQRGAALDGGTAWTWKTCEHCARVTNAYCRAVGVDEWEPECVVEWLADEWSSVYAAMLAGWRYPDGGLTPPPFPPSCIECGTPVVFGALWCGPCDEARIARLDAQFADLAAAFEAAHEAAS